MKKLTVTSHSHGKALLKPAILTPVGMMLGDFTVLVASALVAKLFPDGPLEEAFAAFTTYCSIVAAWKKIK